MPLDIIPKREAPKCETYSKWKVWSECAQASKIFFNIDLILDTVYQSATIYFHPTSLWRKRGDHKDDNSASMAYIRE